MKTNAKAQVALIALTLHLSPFYGTARGEHDRPAPKSTPTSPARRSTLPANGKAASPPIQVVDKWEPNTEVQLKSVREMTEYYVDRANAARKRVKDDPTIPEEEKTRLLEMIGRFETTLLESTEAMRKQDVMALAINFCTGYEWDWSFLLGGTRTTGALSKVKNNLSPGGVGLGCVTLAWTRNAESGSPNFLPTIGGSVLVGPKAEWAEYENETRKFHRLEEVKGFAVMLPLGNQSGVLKIADLTGAYVGGGADIAFAGRNLNSGLSDTRNFTAYVNADVTVWPPRPKVAMFVRTKSESAQNRFLTGKLQGLYFMGTDVPYQEQFHKGIKMVTQYLPFFEEAGDEKAKPPVVAPVPPAELDRLLKEGQGVPK